MAWQDFVISGGGLLFAVLLIPTIRNEDAVVPLKTSALTALTLAVFAYTFSTMGMWMSSGSNLLTATGWAFVAALRRP